MKLDSQTVWQKNEADFEMKISVYVLVHVFRMELGADMCVYV